MKETKLNHSEQGMHRTLFPKYEGDLSSLPRFNEVMFHTQLQEFNRDLDSLHLKLVLIFQINSLNFHSLVKNSESLGTYKLVVWSQNFLFVS